MSGRTLIALAAAGGVAAWMAGMAPGAVVPEAAVAAFASVKVPSNVSVFEETKTYPIRGRTGAELIAQMQANGPKGFWAYTNWYVRWDRSCYVRLSIRYTLPEWVDKQNAPPELQRTWEHMIDRLRHHELGHGQHGKHAAQEIGDSSCRNAPHLIVRKWSRKDREYDAQTGHGKTQGVALR
ncbi:MAG: DUF922 domain-containing protein [Beijerinckiaceae bacterium]